MASKTPLWDADDTRIIATIIALAALLIFVAAVLAIAVRLFLLISGLGSWSGTQGMRLERDTGNAEGSGRSARDFPISLLAHNQA
jgi:hypothetical protein